MRALMTPPALSSLLLLATLLPPAFAADKSRKPSTTATQKGGLRTPGVQIPFSSLKADNQFDVGGQADAILITDSVWVAKSNDAILPIDPKKEKAGEAIGGLKQPCGGMTSGFGSLWVPTCGDHSLVRIDAKTPKITATISTGTGSAKAAIAATADSVWILSDDKTTLQRIDPDANRIVAEIRLPAGCSHIAAAEGSLWVSCPKENRVLRIDPQTNLVADRLEVAARPGPIASGEGSIWVLCQAEGKVARIDPKTKKVTATIDLAIPNSDASNGAAIAVGEGSVWITANGFPLTRIHPQSEKVMQQFYGDGGGAIRTNAGSVWLLHTAKGTLQKIDPKRVAATLAE